MLNFAAEKLHVGKAHLVFIILCGGFVLQAF